jgi:hypothetical protein
MAIAKRAKIQKQDRTGFTQDQINEVMKRDGITRKSAIRKLRKINVAVIQNSIRRSEVAMAKPAATSSLPISTASQRTNTIFPHPVELRRLYLGSVLKN